MAFAAHGHAFGSLAEVMAKANEEKSGDRLAGLAAADASERVAAKTALADVRVRRFVDEPLVPPEHDEPSAGAVVALVMPANHQPGTRHRWIESTPFAQLIGA